MRLARYFNCFSCIFGKPRYSSNAPSTLTREQAFLKLLEEIALNEILRNKIQSSISKIISKRVIDSTYEDRWSGVGGLFCSRKTRSVGAKYRLLTSLTGQSPKTLFTPSDFSTTRSIIKSGSKLKNMLQGAYQNAVKCLYLEPHSTTTPTEYRSNLSQGTTNSTFYQPLRKANYQIKITDIQEERLSAKKGNTKTSTKEAIQSQSIEEELAESAMPSVLKKIKELLDQGQLPKTIIEVKKTNETIETISIQDLRMYLTFEQLREIEQKFTPYSLPKSESASSDTSNSNSGVNTSFDTLLDVLHHPTADELVQILQAVYNPKEILAAERTCTTT